MASSKPFAPENVFRSLFFPSKKKAGCCVFSSPKFLDNDLTPWWFLTNPSAKICASQTGSSPGVGRNTKYLKPPPNFTSQHLQQLHCRCFSLHGWFSSSHFLVISKISKNFPGKVWVSSLPQVSWKCCCPGASKRPFYPLIGGHLTP